MSNLMLRASGDVLKICRNIFFYSYYEYAVSLRLVCIFSEILHFFRKILSSVTVIPSCIYLYIDYFSIQSFIFICSSYLFAYLYYDIYLFIYQYVLTLLL
jgi:hypothetical protein